MDTHPLRICIVGMGSIASFVLKKYFHRPEFEFVYAIVNRLDKKNRNFNFPLLTDFSDNYNVDVVLECAGHEALKQHGTAFLEKGVDIISVSPGALWDRSLVTDLEKAALFGNSTIEFPSGAIGGLDALRAAAIGKLDSVTYKCFKPEAAWPKDSIPEHHGNGPVKIFSGTCRNAAKKFPKNVNVCALVALAGLGLDKTRAELWLDSSSNRNIHLIETKGDCGEMRFKLSGNTLSTNKATSLLAAHSICSALERRIKKIII